MSELPLRELGLEAKWPRLQELQTEVAELTRQVQKAGGEVQALEAQVQVARTKDLDAEARAVRAGKKGPETSEESKVQSKLDAARRNRDVLQRALEAAQGDLATLRAKHQVALYQDVLAARAKIAQDLAAHASKALQGFGEWSDLHYLLRDLKPADPPPDENRPAERVTIVPTVQAVRTPGPDRGHVEGMLRYLISLAPRQEGEEDAA